MITRFEQFSYVISGIYREIQKIEKDEMIKHGYRGAFAIYLATLHRNPQGLTSAQLCEVCDKDKAAVSRIIAEMEEKELVQREKNNYRSKITLTEKGKEIAEFVAKRAMAAVGAVSGEVMTEQKREDLYNTLSAIYKNLKTVSKEGIPE